MTLEDMAWLFFGGVLGVIGTLALYGAGSFIKQALGRRRMLRKFNRVADLEDG